MTFVTKQRSSTRTAAAGTAEPMATDEWDYRPEPYLDGDGGYDNWDYNDGERAGHVTGGPGQWYLTVTQHPVRGELGEHPLPDWDTADEALSHAGQILKDPQYDHNAVEGIEHLKPHDAHQVITARAEALTLLGDASVADDQAKFNTYMDAGLRYYHVLEAHGLEPIDDWDSVRPVQSIDLQQDTGRDYGIDR